MSNEILAVSFTVIIVVLGSSVLATRLVVSRRNREMLRSRLEELIGSSTESALSEFRISGASERRGSRFEQMPGYANIDKLLKAAGSSYTPSDLLQFSILLLVVPLILALGFDLPVLPCVCVASLLALSPYMILRMQAEKKRSKFQNQLPDAIELMVSILKSGHSVPRSIRSVAEEMPAPCGSEFNEIFNRMSLGQTLPDALSGTVDRYGSFELDMLRRATAIQVEVGGSLSELLEKTNATLRQRIKLKGQVGVLTAQSRLSAWIIGLMPLFVVVGFQLVNPEYMQPLTDTNIGRLLLVAAAFAMVTGIIIMRKLSTIRV
ncbi:MAG: type II secretion system F family protein [Candidatus Obscuribacterales bacterium]|nr:type II secretion system F family protein [Candidatus Obscuribacterales bacterium]